MYNPDQLDKWLQGMNAQLRAEDVAHRRRPFEAIQRYAVENKISIDLFSDVGKHIFAWFRRNAPEGAHALGSAYESVYYFDSVFWVISIPMISGTVALDARNSIIAMPTLTKDALFENPNRSWDYLIYWADCVDYGFGHAEVLQNNNLDEFGGRFYAAGDEELRAATLLLRQHRPQARALMNCRNATEMFFKSYLAFKGQLTEKEAIQIGHNLKKALDKFIEVSGFQLWRSAETQLAVFPAISDRYDGLRATNADLATAFAFAQSVGAAVTREFTDHNMIERVARQNHASFPKPTNK
jgi:hypothetical protein